MACERRPLGRPRQWTEAENRLLLALGEKFPGRGELRQHLTNVELELPDQFPGKTIGALMVQHMRLSKAKRGSQTEYRAGGRAARTRGGLVTKRLENMGEGEASEDSHSESESQSDSESGMQDSEDRDNIEVGDCGNPDVRVVIPEPRRPGVAQLQKSQGRAIPGPDKGDSYPFTYRAGSFVCKIDRQSPSSPNPSRSPTEQQETSGPSPLHQSPVEMTGGDERPSTATALYDNATKYHQENLMRERELLYAISEAGDDIEMAEKRAHNARSRRESLRRQLGEVRERVRIGSEMHRVLQKQLHHVDG